MSEKPPYEELEKQIIELQKALQDERAEKALPQQQMLSPEKHTESPLEEFEFVTKTAAELYDWRPDKYIYQIIGGRLKEIVGDAIVIINSYDKISNMFTTQYLVGLGRYAESILNLINRNPIGMTAEMNDPEAKEMLLTGKFKEGPKGIYELSFKTIPKGICRTIEVLLNVGGIYGIGFSYRGELFGNSMIITRKGDNETLVKNRTKLIETFIAQAAIALQRNRFEETLQEREQFLTSLLKAIPLPVFYKDREGKYIACNDTFTEIMGVTDKDIKGKTVYELWPTEHAKKYHEKDLEILKSREHQEYEFVVQDKHGQRRPVIYMKDVFYNARGEIAGIVGAFLDITERLKLEEELRQSHKMEAIGTLAGGVAHDFNNILYMISGNAELAMEDIPEWNPVHANLKEIKSAALRAAGIVKQLLNFSRKTDPGMQSIGAVTVIKDTLKFLRATIPTSIEIRKHLPDAEVTILADPIQINQVLMNICSNASQVMEETGGILEITVQTESLQEGCSSSTFSISSGDYLKVEVSDTGPGIDSEIIDQIFDPYFTTKDVGEGSGMGLAVVHGIVKNHNGAITVASQPGEGAIFTVYLPLSSEELVVETKEPDKIPRGAESILFVDDEESIATMGGKMLNKLGYEVETKTNPTEVLELFKSTPKHFDLIISDMTMPQMSGVELSERLKGVRSDIPVIICTGHSSLIDEEKAKKIGIEGFVMKPIVKSELAKTIRKVLDKTKNKNQR